MMSTYVQKEGRPQFARTNYRYPSEAIALDVEIQNQSNQHDKMVIY